MMMTMCAMFVMVLWGRVAGCIVAWHVIVVRIWIVLQQNHIVYNRHSHRIRDSSTVWNRKKIYVFG